MNFDFPLFLVIATFVTGFIWLADALFFAKKRRVSTVGETAQAPTKEASEEEEQPKEPLLVEYSRSFFPVILAVLVLRSFVAEPFRIPSGSMMPTLLIGDFILVNKFTYGIRLPVLNTKIVELNNPKRGDVVVFKYPQNTKLDYIKRVIGVPGDVISYQSKQLTINGEVQMLNHQDIYTGSGSGSRNSGALRSIEQLGDVEHEILINQAAPDFGYGCQVLRQGAFKVPEGHYFVMGDNRDNSNDSRCWGLVPEELLVGKAFAIWMHWDSNRPGLGVAWDRIGNGIH